MKILLAVDGSAWSDAAVNSVAHRPWPEGTTIKVFSCIEPVFYPTTETWMMPESYYEEVEKAGQESAWTAINKAAERLCIAHSSSVEIIREVKGGHAKDAILEE